MQCECVVPTGTYSTGTGPHYTECTNKANYKVITWQGHVFRCCTEHYKQLYPNRDDYKYSTYIGF